MKELKELLELCWDSGHKEATNSAIDTIMDRRGRQKLTFEEMYNSLKLEDKLKSILDKESN